MTVTGRSVRPHAWRGKPSGGSMPTVHTLSMMLRRDTGSRFRTVSTMCGLGATLVLSESRK